MGYDPSEPRGKGGKWTGGSARGHNAGGGNRALAIAIGKGALQGVAEGVIASTVVGAVTGGFGELAAPAIIARSVASGAIAGAKLGVHPANVALNAVLGGTLGLNEHKSRMKSAIGRQHKEG